LNKSSFVGVLGIKHDNFLLLVSVLLKDLLFDFEVILVEGFRGIKVALGVKPDGLDIFLIGRINLPFLCCFAGFSDNGFDSNHLFSKIKYTIVY
jgi:hypothetical protein